MIPFYGIVGNHERKNDEQWLDLLRRTGVASRLSRQPTVVGNVALYGIDAVQPSIWDSIDFELEEPSEEPTWTILCMHELLSPIVSGKGRVYPTSEMLDRVGIEIDGLALGDFHQPESVTVDGTDIWYATATERGEKDQEETGVVQLIDVDNDGITRRQIELDTRPFVVSNTMIKKVNSVPQTISAAERGVQSIAGLTAIPSTRCSIKEPSSSRTFPMKYSVRDKLRSFTQAI